MAQDALWLCPYDNNGRQRVNAKMVAKVILWLVSFLEQKLSTSSNDGDGSCLTIM